MGVSRNITIHAYSKIENPFQLISKLLIGFWIKNEYSTISMFYNDETDNDVLPYEIEFNKIESLFILRSNNLKINIISFKVDQLNEGIILSVKKIKKDNNNEYLYEFWISPGGAHTLINYPRNTDFSFYLNQILPRMEEIGCQIWEITCNDFG